LDSSSYVTSKHISSTHDSIYFLCKLFILFLKKMQTIFVDIDIQCALNCRYFLNQNKQLNQTESKASQAILQLRRTLIILLFLHHTHPLFNSIQNPKILNKTQNIPNPNNGIWTKTKTQTKKPTFQWHQHFLIRSPKINQT